MRCSIFVPPFNSLSVNFFCLFSHIKFKISPVIGHYKTQEQVGQNLRHMTICFIFD